MPHLEPNLGIPRARYGRDSGFTLIELMIVAAIVAILAAIALPSYADYIQRSKISEAISNLSDMRTRLEQFYLDNRKYPAGPGNCVTSGTTDTNINLPPAQKYFTISCSTMNTGAYVILATGNPAEGMSTDFKYSVNEANSRTTVSVPTGWSGTGKACWVIRKSGGC